jgi:hypothetical protein
MQREVCAESATAVVPQTLAISSMQRTYVSSIAALAAVLSRDCNAHETVLRHLLDGLSRELLFLIGLLCERLYFVLCEISEQGSRHFMFFV